MNAKPTNDRSNLADLVRDIIGLDDDDARMGVSPPPAASTEIELALSDLISDDQGEIVFFNDSGFRTLSIKTHSAVVSNGQAETHKTASGEDVSGFHYITFDNGMTLYFEEGLDLLLP
ncbi:MAG: hypothetical protein ACR2Q4_23145 [Geminicoccaceae bacterium]